MGVQQLLHMNVGEGETSYANNSLPQRTTTLKTKPILEEAIQQLCATTIPNAMCIADLGCSSGPNALLPLTMILDAVQASCSRSGNRSPEFQVFLNDLPGNDFNTIFKRIPLFHEKLQVKKGDELGSCFIAGAPGSFYGRLFPAGSLHFVYSVNSLHWLSQAPLGFRGEMHDINKGNIALGRTSPSAAFEAYLDQFRRDFTAFLQSRSVEIIRGGRMVLSLMGRRFANPSAPKCSHFWDDLALALRDLVAEGIVEEAKLDSFNMPYYEPHIEELREVIEEEGSFDIVRLEELCNVFCYDSNGSQNVIDHNMYSNTIRAVTEPMLASHFGLVILRELFVRFEERLSRRGTRKDVFLVVSLIRKE